MIIAFPNIPVEIRMQTEDYSMAQCFEQDKISIVENYLLTKSIIYCMGGIGPRCYDCGGILTEALKVIGYKGEKISSFSKGRFKNFKQAKRGDILVNTNDGERHVALITSDYSNGSVTILDYVTVWNKANYRKHGYYKGIFVLDLQL